MSPEEDRTRDTVDSEPKHYQLSYSGPHWFVCLGLFLCTLIWYMGFMGILFFLLVGCFSMIIWTPAALSVLYECVLYFSICTCSVKLNMFHMERRSRNMLIIIIIIINWSYCPTFHTHTHLRRHMVKKNMLFFKNRYTLLRPWNVRFTEKICCNNHTACLQCTITLT